MQEEGQAVRCFRKLAWSHVMQLVGDKGELVWAVWAGGWCGSGLAALAAVRCAWLAGWLAGGGWFRQLALAGWLGGGQGGGLAGWAAGRLAG